MVVPHNWKFPQRKFNLNKTEDGQDKVKSPPPAKKQTPVRYYLGCLRGKLWEHP
jgi:hypothetical protein